MKAKLIIALLIGLLIGTLFGNSTFNQNLASYYDEIYYLKKICDSLSNIESKLDNINSDLSSVDSKVVHIMCSVNWIKYWIKYCSGNNQSLIKKNLEVHNENPH